MKNLHIKYVIKNCVNTHDKEREKKLWQTKKDCTKET